MTSWYVNELSKITGVSVQTLHHYDRKDVLKPSLRRPNGYRVYTPDDLLKLQQIIALKFFGFELKQIKNLLDGDIDPLKHFEIQVQFLDEKAKAMGKASETLKEVLKNADEGKPLSWENIVETIEVFKMTQDMEKTWAGEVMNPEELEQYAKFIKEVDTKFAQDPKAHEAFLKERSSLIELAMTNLETDPKSDVSFDIAHRWMKMINGIYGPENAEIKQAVWEKGFKQNKIKDKREMSPEMVKWLDQAIDAYWRRRIYTLLDEVEKGPKVEHRVAWEGILAEMCGDSERMKQEIYKAAETDDRVGPKTKAWLAGL